MISRFLIAHRGEFETRQQNATHFVNPAKLIICLYIKPNVPCLDIYHLINPLDIISEKKIKKKKKKENLITLVQECGCTETLNSYSIHD